MMYFFFGLAILSGISAGMEFFENKNKLPKAKIITPFFACSVFVTAILIAAAIVVMVA